MNRYVFSSLDPLIARDYSFPSDKSCDDCIKADQRCEFHESFKHWEQVKFGKVIYLGSAGKLLEI